MALIAKTAEPHPKLEGTVHTAADEIRIAGGNARPADRAYGGRISIAVEYLAEAEAGLAVSGFVCARVLALAAASTVARKPTMETRRFAMAG